MRLDRVPGDAAYDGMQAHSASLAASPTAIHRGD